MQSVPVSFPSASVFDVLEKQSCCAHTGKGFAALGAQEQIIHAGIFSRVLNCCKLSVSVPRLEEDGVKYYSISALP